MEYTVKGDGHWVLEDWHMVASSSIRVWLNLRWPDKDQDLWCVLRVHRGKALAHTRTRVRKDSVRPRKMLDFCLVEWNRDRDLCPFR